MQEPTTWQRPGALRRRHSSRQALRRRQGKAATIAGFEGGYKEKVSKQEPTWR
jgi:hypothetical protein